MSDKHFILWCQKMLRTLITQEIDNRSIILHNTHIIFRCLDLTFKRITIKCNNAEKKRQWTWLLKEAIWIVSTYTILVNAHLYKTFQSFKVFLLLFKYFATFLHINKPSNVIYKATKCFILHNDYLVGSIIWILL